MLPSRKEPPQGTGGNGHAVIEVLCNDQGMTDHRQRITLTVDDSNPATPPITATADLPEHTTSKDFATLLAFVLQQQGCPGYITEPEIHPEFDPFKSHQINLPDGYRITNAKVQKRQSSGTGWTPGDPDHLRCFIGGDRRNGRLGFPGQLTYTTFDFSINSGEMPLTVEFHMRGTDLDDGTTIAGITSVTYPKKVRPQNWLVPIGQYLQNLGMVVTYQGSNRLHVDVGPSNIQVDSALFMINTNADVPEFSLEYSFIAN